MAKSFSWDSEELIGTIEETDKKHHEIKVCTLKNKEYVSIAEKQLTVENEWKYKKNRVLPIDLFRKVQNVLDQEGY